MGRKKKDELEEKQDTDTALEALDAEQAESVELEAAEEEVAPAPARKAARSPRSRKSAEPVKELEPEEEVSKASEEPLEIEASADEEMPSGKGSRLDVAMKKNVALASTTAKKSMDSMEKQWEAIQEISLGVCTNLEKVQGLMKDIPANFAGGMHELLKPPIAKTSPITKVGMGASVLALVLSLLSLSLSQTARQAALNAQVANFAPPVQNTTTAAVSTEKPRFSQLPVRRAAPELALRPDAHSRPSAPLVWRPNARSRK